MIVSYKELVVWQRSMQLVREVYRLVKFLPSDERYALSDQLRRAVVSISSNIAEGYARKSQKEYVNFLSIALGSNAEVETQLLICVELGYIQQEDLSTAIGLVEEVRKMLIKMRQSILDTQP